MMLTKIQKNGLSERQLKALPFLISSSSEVEACRQAKISKDTYYKWMKQPEMRDELRRCRNLVVEDAVEVLKSHTLKAVNVLVRLLDNESPAMQRSVANDIIGHVGRFKELQEIEKRMEAIEDIQVKSEEDNGNTSGRKKT